MEKVIYSLLLGLCLIGIVSASEYGYNNPRLPKIFPNVITTTTGGSSSGGFDNTNICYLNESEIFLQNITVRGKIIGQSNEFCFTQGAGVSGSSYLSYNNQLMVEQVGAVIQHNGSITGFTFMGRAGAIIAGNEPNLTYSLNVSNNKMFNITFFNVATNVILRNVTNYPRGIYNFTPNDNITGFRTSVGTGGVTLFGWCMEYTEDE